MQLSGSSATFREQDKIDDDDIKSVQLKHATKHWTSLQKKWLDKLRFEAFLSAPTVIIILLTGNSFV